MTVLSNLMEKCPPAEACRDAFDRMAKATVAMCLSTTGFGARPAPVFGVPPPSFTSNATQASAALNPGSISTHQPPPPQQPFFAAPAPSTAASAATGFPTSRPRPQFDMSLRDLFPDDTTDRQSFRAIKWGATGAGRGPLPHAPPVLPSTAPLTYPAAAAASPGSTAAASSYTTYAPSAADDASSSYTGDASGGAFPPADLGDGGTLGGWDGGSASLDLDRLLADAATAGAYPGSAGMSLGFDADHDWNDGCPPDLLDGYWFRSGAWSGGGVGLNGNGGPDEGGFDGGGGVLGEMEVGGEGEGDVAMG